MNISGRGPQSYGEEGSMERRKQVRNNDRWGKAGCPGGRRIRSRGRGRGLGTGEGRGPIGRR